VFPRKDVLCVCQSVSKKKRFMLKWIAEKMFYVQVSFVVLKAWTHFFILKWITERMFYVQRESPKKCFMLKWVAEKMFYLKVFLRKNVLCLSKFLAIILSINQNAQVWPAFKLRKECNNHLWTSASHHRICTRTQNKCARAQFKWFFLNPQMWTQCTVSRPTLPFWLTVYMI
jgi:hypothetical protein